MTYSEAWLINPNMNKFRIPRIEYKQKNQIKTKKENILGAMSKKIPKKRVKLQG